MDAVDEGKIPIVKMLLPDGLNSVGQGIIKANYTRAELQIHRSMEMLYRERDGYSQDEIIEKAPKVNTLDFASKMAGDDLNPDY